MSKVFSVRLGDELGARVVELAAARGVKAPTILKAAVEGYVGDCGRGLPEAVAAPREPEPVVPAAGGDLKARLAAIEAKAAAGAERARQERARRIAERGW